MFSNFLLQGRLVSVFNKINKGFINDKEAVLVSQLSCETQEVVLRNQQRSWVVGR